MTRREVITQALSSSDGFRTAQEVYADLRGSGARIGLTTVYRHLQALAAEGAADLLRTPDGEAAYRLCGSAHHHHLVCRSCGRTVEVRGPAVERWAYSVASEHGFRDVEHTVEIFGTCADC